LSDLDPQQVASRATGHFQPCFPASRTVNRPVFASKNEIEWRERAMGFQVFGYKITIDLYVSETLCFPTVFLWIDFRRCPIITFNSQREATSSLCETNYTQFTEGRDGRRKNTFTPIERPATQLEYFHPSNPKSTRHPLDHPQNTKTSTSPNQQGPTLKNDVCPRSTLADRLFFIEVKIQRE
jgi:hypothetical protein